MSIHNTYMENNKTKKKQIKKKQNITKKKTRV